MGGLIFAIVLFAVALIGVAGFYLGRTKCPYCKSRKVTVMQKNVLYTEPVLFKEEVKIKEYDNKNNYRTEGMLDAMSNQYLNPPKKIMTQEVVVQGKRVWYEVKYQCSECQKEFLKKEYVDKKPIIK